MRFLSEELSDGSQQQKRCVRAGGVGAELGRVWCCVRRWRFCMRSRVKSINNERDL